MNARPQSNRPLAASQHALGVRRRLDLQIVPVTYEGEEAFVAKDPLSLRYFRLRADEFFVLTLLNGLSTLASIRDAYHRRFPTRRVTFRDLQSLLFRFHKLGLVVADQTEQGTQLLQRANAQRKRKWLSTLTNVLFLKFPGVDPDRFLNRVYPRVRFLFSPMGMLLALATLLSAFLVITANFAQFIARLPSLESFFQADGLLTLVLIISGTKVLHELGHAFTCMHYGGECHQIGLMLMVFTPALYCDTSDSWLLRNKWQRAAVGVAGMYVEVLLAAIATLIWWNTNDGWMHFIALRVMLVCSVSTVLFNANPLLRYDGYFILSDLINFPNLAERSQRLLRSTLRSVCLGVPSSNEEPFNRRQKAGLLAYAISAFLYRIILVTAILLMLSRMLRPYGIESIGNLLIVFTLVGMSLPALINARRTLRRPRNGAARLSGLRMLGLTLTLGGLIALFLLPLPHHVEAVSVVRPRDLSPVYATAAGFVEEVLFKPGDEVKRGDLLIRLVNPSLELELVQLKAKVDAQRLTIETLRRTLVGDSESGVLLPTATTALVDLERQLAKKQRQIESLRVTAPRDGVVLAPDQRVLPEDETQLPFWQGQPWDFENLRSFLDVGTHLFSIAPSSNWTAELVVDQSVREQLAIGQQVEIMLEAFPGVRLSGKVTDLATERLRDVPHRLTAAAGGSIATLATESQPHAPMQTTYQAFADFESEAMPIVHGQRGWAKIAVSRQPLWERLYRELHRVIRF